MFRQRRRRSSAFTRRQPMPSGFVLLGAGALIVIGLFFFFLRQADVLAPEPSEIRVALPDAS